jgi:hypothetical protein
MLSLDLHLLLLVPVGLAVAFLGWVFWNFGKESRKEYHRR